MLVKFPSGSCLLLGRGRRAVSSTTAIAAEEAARTTARCAYLDAGGGNIVARAVALHDDAVADLQIILGTRHGLADCRAGRQANVDSLSLEVGNSQGVAVNLCDCAERAALPSRCTGTLASLSARAECALTSL